MKIFLLALLTLVASSLEGIAQGYKIGVRIDGQQDTTLIMGNFFGDRTYVKDTAQLQNGTYVFEGDQPLEQGMYFVAAGKSRLFDFVVYKDQHFDLSTSGPDFLENMNVTGSADNELFVEDMKFNMRMNQEAAPYLKIMEDSTADQEAKTKAQAAVNDINSRVQTHQNTIIEEHPDSFLARIFTAQKRITPPDGLDREAAIEYYKAHFWDNFDLADPMFLRLNLPLYREKVNTWLDRLHIQHPDSLKPAVDQVISIASQNEETYKYVVWMLTLKYQNPSIMGLDELYVYLYDNYYTTGKMDFWANEQLKKNLGEYATQLRNSLIGRKAPNMIMLDDNLQRKSLYDIPNEYTLVYFFDPDCHHCKLATPVLDKIYDSEKFDLEVFAVSTDTSMVKMKEYIRDMELDWITVNGPRTETAPYYELYDAMTTPTIYILDRNKKIIAKKLPVDRIEEFLIRYSGSEND